MKKKYKISDVTKFTIALGLCLCLILVSIVLVNVFTHYEKSAKAETISNDGYSFAVYNNVYDGQLTNLALTNNVYGDQWNKLFVYFANDGQPINFYGNKYNFHLTFDFYNPNRVGIAYCALNESAESWTSIIGQHDVASDDIFIRRTIDYGTISSNVGSVLFEISSQINVYLTHLQVSFTWNSQPVVISFGNQAFYNAMIAEYERGYSDGLSYGTTDAKFGIFNAATFTTSFVKEDQSVDVVQNIQPILNNSTLSWENVYDYWLENYFEIENIDNVVIKINFAQSFDFASNPIYVRVDSDVTDFVFNDRYNASWNYLASSITNADTLLTLDSNQNAPNTFQVYSLSIYFGRVSDTLSVGYINATNDSFNQGRQVGFLEGFDEGVATGNSGRENEMYNLGYNRGFAAGSQGQYSFATLFTAAIEAPINAVLNGFNVEILGMNLRNFYLSLFSLAIVIVVIKLILFRRN